MKNRHLTSIVALVAIVVVGAAFAFISYQPASEPAMEKEGPAGSQSAQAAEASEAMEKENSTEGAMEKDAPAAGEGSTMEKASYSGQLIAGSETPYVRYNKADFDKARSEGKAIYLYFYATWCPLCAAERPKIIDTFDSLSVPGAVGFEAHWSDGQDTAEDDDLARLYGISSQHTHVFIGKDGSVLSKKIGALSEGELESRLKEAAQA